MKNLLALAVLGAGLSLAQAQNFNVTMTGASERPSPNASTGTGTGTLFLSGANLSYDITYSGLTGNPTAAHIHGPADVNTSAGVLFGITANGALGTSGRYTGSATLTAQQIVDLNNGQLYANIHTASFPGGEIRGQVTAVPEPSTFALFGLGLGFCGMLARRKKTA